MCGIAGMIDVTLGRDRGDCLLQKMLESIRYRGPDNSSTWADMPVFLGHNRLSIIDLSDAANQPMEFDDLVLVYSALNPSTIYTGATSSISARSTSRLSCLRYSTISSIMRRSTEAYCSSSFPTGTKLISNA